MKKMLLALMATAMISTPALADHSRATVTVYPTGNYGYENGVLVKYNPRFRPAPVVVTINNQSHYPQYRNHNRYYDTRIQYQYPNYHNHHNQHHRRDRKAEKVIKTVVAGALIYDIIKD
jgi:hypothetical protein